MEHYTDDENWPTYHEQRARGGRSGQLGNPQPTPASRGLDYVNEYLEAAGERLPISKARPENLEQWKDAALALVITVPAKAARAALEALATGEWARKLAETDEERDASQASQEIGDKIAQLEARRAQLTKDVTRVREQAEELEEDARQHWVENNSEPAYRIHTHIEDTRRLLNDAETELERDPLA